MQTHHFVRRDGSTPHLEWMGLVIAVLALVGLTAGGIHASTRQFENIRLVATQN